MFPAIMSPELTPMPMSSWTPPLARPPAVELAEFAHHFHRGRHRIVSMINVVHGRAEQRHHHVADEFVDRPTVSKDHLDHAREVLIQLRDEILGIALLGDGGKTAQV